MVIAPPAPHAPFTPANRHFEIYRNITAKRTVNFNKLENPEVVNLEDKKLHSYVILLI